MLRRRHHQNPRLTSAELTDIAQRLGPPDEDIETQFHDPDAAARLLRALDESTNQPSTNQ